MYHPCMSEREQIQETLANFLIDHGDKFNAPYGVLTGTEPFGRGKVRTITFGVARYLDATINIISADLLQIQGQGALAHKFQGHYKSVDEVLNVLKSYIN